MEARKFKVLIDLPHLDLKENDIVYEFCGHDYGCVRDDAFAGLQTIACTLTEEKDAPFKTIELRHLGMPDGSPVPEGQYSQ